MLRVYPAGLDELSEIVRSDADRVQDANMRQLAAIKQPVHGRGAHAKLSRVVNAGPVTTYGPNDMVLDNWGEVRIIDYEVSRSTGQFFLNLAMKLLPRCCSAFIRLWPLHSSRMFPIVGLPPRATSRSWSNSS